MCENGTNNYCCQIDDTRVDPTNQLLPQIISRQCPRDLCVPNIKAAVSIAYSTIGIWVLYSLK